MVMFAQIISVSMQGLVMPVVTLLTITAFGAVLLGNPVTVLPLAM